MACKRPAVVALLAAVALVGIALVPRATAGASVGVPARHGSGVSYARVKVAHHPKFDLRKLQATAAGSTSIGATTLASVTTSTSASLTGPAPACYGDSRPITPVGGTLDPSSFGAFYNCAQHTWTFEVVTADTFSPGAFGAWSVSIDTDGNFSDGCGGAEYGAAVFQSAPNQYRGIVGSLDSGCNLAQTGAATLTLAPNGVAMTFPWTAIGDSSTLAWNASLQSESEIRGNLDGDPVPAPTFVDAVVQGAVLDSIPPPSPPNCSAGVTATSEKVATTADSHRAAAILSKAGFGSVHDYGEGIVSFTGDGSAADAILASAGLKSRVSAAHVRTTESVAVPNTGTASPPDDPLYSSQWNLPIINAPGAWAVTTGTNIVVADIDTGVDFTQADLPSPQLVPGVDETTSPPTSIDYPSGNTDTDGHGTAVAGVIAAATNNDIGLSSLGWNTSVMPVKASTNGTFTTAALAAGIIWAADNGARIINLSVGGPCPDSTEQAAITYAVEQRRADCRRGRQRGD